MSDKQYFALRLIAIVGVALLVAVALIAVGAFLMATSDEARQFIGNARDVTVFAIVAGVIVWASKHGMRT